MPYQYNNLRKHLLPIALLLLLEVSTALLESSNTAFTVPIPPKYRIEQRKSDKHAHYEPDQPACLEAAGLEATTSFLSSHSRRDALNAAVTAIATGLFTVPTPSIGSPLTDFTPSTGLQPLADLPMVRLKLPQGAFGREYIVVKLNIENQGQFEFMVDSGLTLEMITPHLRDSIIRSKGGSSSRTITGLGAGGASENPLVKLEGVSLVADNSGKSSNLPLASPLNAIVTDFPQEHIDPEHDVEGMIGMEVLEQYDIDFDFPNGRIRFWSPQTFAQRRGSNVNSEDQLIAIPAAVLNESRLEGIRVRSISPEPKNDQPMLGIIDCGASFSTINLAAAQLLGLDVTSLRQEKGAKSVVGIGIDGRKLIMPTTSVQLTFTGNAMKDSSGKVGFEGPPQNFVPWDPVSVAVGDLPVFSQLLGDGKNPLRVPTVLIGLDILSQRQIVLETGMGRSRRIFVSPS